MSAFDAHRVGPPSARRCDIDAADKKGLLLVPKTERGVCKLGPTEQVGVTVYAHRDWWKAAQGFAA